MDRFNSADDFLQSESLPAPATRVFSPVPLQGCIVALIVNLPALCHIETAGARVRRLLTTISHGEIRFE